jgi:hypothetical protein
MLRNVLAMAAVALVTISAEPSADAGAVLDAVGFGGGWRTLDVLHCMEPGGGRLRVPGPVLRRCQIALRDVPERNDAGSVDPDVHPVVF